MGVDREDVLTVAKLLAKKMFIHEMVAYAELGNAITFREQIIKNGTFELYRNGTYSLPFRGPVIWNVILFYRLSR